MIKKQTRLLIALFCTSVLLPLTGPAQESPEDAAESASGEVEISEDNYRRFMELKDKQQQRNFIPETVFQSRGDLQKIDELPEDSQKHLRNQLREIILQGERWQPGDELVDHPLVPSEAARSNQPLKKLEAEAWAELLGEYHQREAENYANAATSKTAMASNEATGEGSGSVDGENANQDGQTSQQIDKEGSGATSDSYSPNISSDSSSSSTVGVAQNALEFLTGRGHGDNQQEAAQTLPVEFVLPAGALAIKDLVNARGITVEPGGDTPAAGAKDEQDDGDG